MTSFSQEFDGVRDVVFVVENTSAAGLHIPTEIIPTYLYNIIDILSEGKATSTPWTPAQSSSTFSLVLFESSDSVPHFSVSYQGPFTSPDKIKDALANITFTGGQGANMASGNEGIALALQTLDNLSKKRDGAFTPAEMEQHIIFISHSPSYEVDVMDVPGYQGKSLDTLMKSIREKGIHFSLVCPRKLPFFIRIFEAAGGDSSTLSEKNFAKEPTHLILPKGLSLPEQPVAPVPSASPALVAPSPMQNPASNQSGQMQPTPSQPHSVPTPPQKVPTPPQPTSTSNVQQGNFGMQQESSSQMMGGNMNNMGPNVMQNQNMNMMMNHQQRPRAGMHQQVVRPMMTQQQRMQLMQNQQRMPQTSVSSNQWSPQQHTSNITAPTQSSVLRDRLSQKVQQQQAAQAAQAAAQQQQGQQGGDNNATLKSLLNHPPQPMAPQGQGQGQGQVRMTALQQQLARPPVSASSSQGGMVGNPQQQAREVIWEGELELIETMKLLEMAGERSGNHVVKCSVTTGKDGKGEVNSKNWPRKLIMQLMPKTLVQKIGNNYFHNSKSVYFHPESSDTLDALTTVLASGYAGCVHFSGSPNCEIKVLILLYSTEKMAYLGFIPDDQVQFVGRIRKIIQEQKAEQQNRGLHQNQMQQQQGMGGPGTSGMMQQQQQQQQQQQMQMGQSSSNMNMSGGSMTMTGQGQVMGGGTGNMMDPQQQQPQARGDIQRIQSLRQELQQELQALQQREQAGGNMQQRQMQQQNMMMGPGMTPQQQQGIGRGNIRQIPQHGGPQQFQRQPGGMMMQRPQQMGAGRGQANANDPTMLRELLE